MWLNMRHISMMLSILLEPKIENLSHVWVSNDRGQITHS